ncbi:hypothetical protein BMS3Bbin16_00547 [archaeon BMS3Bbin16]|nr:hypothetical protein BMS3Bbin16_00547 [archaeon BMS3Bbin16]
MKKRNDSKLLEEKFESSLKKISLECGQGEQVSSFLKTNEKQIIEKEVPVDNPMQLLKEASKLAIFNVPSIDEAIPPNFQMLCKHGGEQILIELYKSLYFGWGFRLKIKTASTLEEAITYASKALEAFEKFDSLFADGLIKIAESGIEVQDGGLYHG